MTYIVQGDIKGKGAALGLADPKTALAVARLWSKEGYTSVNIVGDGRIYTLEEYAAAFEGTPGST